MLCEQQCHTRVDDGLSALTIHSLNNVDYVAYALDAVDLTRKDTQSSGSRLRKLLTVLSKSNHKSTSTHHQACTLNLSSPSTLSRPFIHMYSPLYRCQASRGSLFGYP